MAVAQRVERNLNAFQHFLNDHLLPGVAKSPLQENLLDRLLRLSLGTAIPVPLRFNCRASYG
jgi:hypothetical protein